MPVAAAGELEPSGDLGVAEGPKREDRFIPRRRFLVAVVGGAAAACRGSPGRSSEVPLWRRRGSGHCAGVGLNDAHRLAQRAGRTELEYLAVLKGLRRMPRRHVERLAPDAPALSREARILAAAEACQAMREPRPYRPPRSAEEASSELRGDVRAGRLDGDAVAAVLSAAGHRVPSRREGPAGLTPREVEVLRLLAVGLSIREIATRPVISPKTAGNHVQHIYLKIDASSRARVSLFTLRHGLLPEEELADSPT
jgi:DNA-binding CsgD family transcriptional regulator